MLADSEGSMLFGERDSKCRRTVPSGDFAVDREARSDQVGVRLAGLGWRIDDSSDARCIARNGGLQGGRWRIINRVQTHL